MTRMILISGWAHPSALLQPLADHLADVAEVVLTSPSELWTLSGQGRDPGLYSCALEALIRKQAVPVVLAGWSLGGMIALETALRCPDRISRMVSLSSAARFFSPERGALGVTPARIRTLAKGLQRDWTSTLQGFYASVHSPFPLADSQLAARMRSACGNELDELLLGLDYLATRDLTDRAHTLSCPLLVLHGGQDRVVEPGLGRALAHQVPQAVLKVWEAEGHALPERNPKWVADAIRAFLVT